MRLVEIEPALAYAQITRSLTGAELVAVRWMNHRSRLQPASWQNRPANLAGNSTLGIAGLGGSGERQQRRPQLLMI